MILSNLRANFTFLTLILVLCCFIAQSALGNPGQFPETLHDILRGNSSELTSAASELKDTDLPAALAIVELLKFKALHQETAVTTEQINKFELLIKNRLESSSVVSFSETETCLSKVNTHEIEIDGQKVTVPEYYVANIGLIITGMMPAGEAGTVFPDIQINFISQTPITECSLSINGNTVPNNKISVFDDDNEQGLRFRPDLNVESILSIGTHTAEITIKNKFGESATRKWSFTLSQASNAIGNNGVSFEIEYRNGYLLSKLFNDTPANIRARFFDVSVYPLVVLVHEKNGLITDRNWTKPKLANPERFYRKERYVHVKSHSVRELHIAMDEGKRFCFKADGYYYLVSIAKVGEKINEGILRSNFLKLLVKNGNVTFSESITRENIPVMQRDLMEGIIEKMLIHES